ncbi:SGNH/GDSL hydrolase family protein [Roseomonas elaeocarpi]|uniref:SGNH/GDSL hydrolase family protein n=1 Tax=Roseomonas elaeocarpi TaxID=907779 RepID=A0ABV6JZL2_9PROT
MMDGHDGAAATPNGADSIAVRAAATAGLGRNLAFRGGLLTSLPRVPNTRLTMLTLGDSITARASSNSYMVWAHIRSRKRFFFNQSLNKGISGNTTADVLARFDRDVVPFKPDVITLAVGTNDCRTLPGGALDVSYEGITERLGKILDRCAAIGAFVNLVTVRPNGGFGAFTEEQILRAQRLMLRVNRWILAEQRRRDGIQVIDPWLQWVDPLTGGPRAGVTEDYLPTPDLTHPSAIGGFAEGAVHLAMLAPMLNAGNEPHLIRSVLDTYDAEDNPGGNLLANGLLQGSDGRAVAGVSGSVATSWTLSTAAPGNSGTIVGSKENWGSRGERQVVTITDRVNPNGAVAADFVEVVALDQLIRFSSGVYAPGDVLEGCLDIEVSASTGVSGVYLELREEAGTGTPPVATIDPLLTNRFQAGPADAWSGILGAEAARITVRAPASEGHQLIRFRVAMSLVTGGAGASVTVKAGQATLRKVNAA